MHLADVRPRFLKNQLNSFKISEMLLVDLGKINLHLLLILTINMALVLETIGGGCSELRLLSILGLSLL